MKLALPVPRVAPVLHYCWEWPIPPWGNMFTKMKTTLVIVFSCKGGHNDITIVHDGKLLRFFVPHYVRIRDVSASSLHGMF